MKLETEKKGKIKWIEIDAPNNPITIKEIKFMV